MQLRTPSIRGITDHERLIEMERYLKQLVPELQFAFDTIEKDISTVRENKGVSTDVGKNEHETSS